MAISEEQLYASLQQACKQLWQVGYRSVILLGEGVYGRCYGATLACAPYRAVVKIHKYTEVGEQEQRQLMELSGHLSGLVPRVYGYLTGKVGGDMLVMEWLPGQSCPRPEDLPYPVRRSLQQQAVELLLSLHAIEHPQGYGSFDGPFYSRWWDYYGQRVEKTYQAIMSSEEARAYLGPQVLGVMERSRQLGEQILSTSKGRPALLHGDFAFGNLLFDTQKWQITGLIDPLDAEWGDRELDLVNIVNGHVKHKEGDHLRFADEPYRSHKDLLSPIIDMFLLLFYHGHFFVSMY